MQQGQGTEVTYRTTGDCSIELGTPKEGRIKIYFEADEISDVEKAHHKIDRLGNILAYARKRVHPARGEQAQ